MLEMSSSNSRESSPDPLDIIDAPIQDDEDGGGHDLIPSMSSSPKKATKKVGSPTKKSSGGGESRTHSHSFSVDRIDKRKSSTSNDGQESHGGTTKKRKVKSREGSSKSLSPAKFPRVPLDERMDVSVSKDGGFATIESFDADLIGLDQDPTVDSSSFFRPGDENDEEEADDMDIIGNRPPNSMATDGSNLDSAQVVQTVVSVEGSESSERLDHTARAHGEPNHTEEAETIEETELPIDKEEISKMERMQVTFSSSEDIGHAVQSDKSIGPIQAASSPLPEKESTEQFNPSTFGMPTPPPTGHQITGESLAHASPIQKTIQPVEMAEGHDVPPSPPTTSAQIEEKDGRDKACSIVQSEPIGVDQWLTGAVSQDHGGSPGETEGEDKVSEKDITVFDPASEVSFMQEDPPITEAVIPTLSDEVLHDFTPLFEGVSASPGESSRQGTPVIKSAKTAKETKTALGGAKKGTKGKKDLSIKAVVKKADKVKKSASSRLDANNNDSVSAKSSENPTTQDEKADKEDTELYCVCRKPYREDDDNVVMVACDACDNWFHPDCVGITPSQLSILDLYICKDCEEKTAQKTSFKRFCKRQECQKPYTGSRSKFCSSSCGFQHATSLIASINDKKTLNQLAADFPAYPKPTEDFRIINHAPTKSTHVDLSDVSRTDRDIMAILTEHLERTNAAIGLVRKRQKILNAAIERCETLETIAVDNEEEIEDGNNKKKKKKVAPAVKEDRPCGWMRALIWDDETIEDWDEEISEEDEICMSGRRRCERHQGWQKTMKASLDVEEMSLNRARDTTEIQKNQIVKAQEFLAAGRRAKEMFMDKLAIRAAKSIT